MNVQASPHIVPGTFFLVVGPSGAGKDSVMRGARDVLADDDRFVFARRTITRPASAGGEDHIDSTVENFSAIDTAGGFCLSWQAHGLNYGIERAYANDIAARRCVVANVSRSVIDVARRRFPRVRIINVTAPRHVLAERLAARGRESAADIRKRLERADEFLPQGADVITVRNAGSLTDSVKVFVGILRLCAFEAA